MISLTPIIGIGNTVFTVIQATATAQPINCPKTLDYLTVIKDLGIPSLLGAVVGSFTIIIAEFIKNKLSKEKGNEERLYEILGELSSFSFSTKQYYSSKFEASIHSDYHELKWIKSGFPKDSLDLDESKRWMQMSESYVDKIIKNNRLLHKCLAKLKYVFRKDIEVKTAIQSVYSLQLPQIASFNSNDKNLDPEEWKVQSKNLLANEVKTKIEAPLLSLIALVHKRICGD